MVWCCAHPPRLAFYTLRALFFLLCHVIVPAAWASDDVALSGVSPTPAAPVLAADPFPSMRRGAKAVLEVPEAFDLNVTNDEATANYALQLQSSLDDHQNRLQKRVGTGWTLSVFGFAGVFSTALTSALVSVTNPPLRLYHVMIPLFVTTTALPAGITLLSTARRDRQHLQSLHAMMTSNPTPHAYDVSLISDQLAHLERSGNRQRLAGIVTIVLGHLVIITGAAYTSANSSGDPCPNGTYSPPQTLACTPGVDPFNIGGRTLIFGGFAIISTGISLTVHGKRRRRFAQAAAQHTLNYRYQTEPAIRLFFSGTGLSATF